MASTDHLERLLAPTVAALGADLDAVELSTAGRRRVLRVIVDRDRDLTLDDIADVTRAVSRRLDTDDAMGERPYTLEVSSRGVDRPLTRPRHWRRNTDRLVDVRLADGRSVRGRIVRADDEAVDLDVGDGTRRLVYAEVSRGRVRVEFKRLEA